jgi:valyl-tRNA synthetase
LRGQLANEQFRSRAPAQVIDGVATTLAETEQKIAGLAARIASLKS